MINKINVKILQHSEVSEKIIKKIVVLKQQNWDYSDESHRKWIETNINRDDYHLYLEDDNENLLAYLNLVFVGLYIDGDFINAVGVGNVCVDNQYKGTGLGLLLMNITKYYIKNLSSVAVLLCRESLVSFYLESGWIQYRKGFIKVATIPYNGEVLFNNNLYINASYIDIERNF